MINKENKNALRVKRHMRIRAKINGTAQAPRMNVYRSTAHIYVQLIDDTTGKTLVSSSTVAKGLDFSAKTKSACATMVGADVAKKALAAGITNVVFDRGGYLYTGRVKALAEGARAAGLVF